MGVFDALSDDELRAKVEALRAKRVETKAKADTVRALRAAQDKGALLQGREANLSETLRQQSLAGTRPDSTGPARMWAGTSFSMFIRRPSSCGERDRGHCLCGHDTLVVLP